MRIDTNNLNITIDGLEVKKFPAAYARGIIRVIVIELMNRGIKSVVSDNEGIFYYDSHYNNNIIVHSKDGLQLEEKIDSLHKRLESSGIQSSLELQPA